MEELDVKVKIENGDTIVVHKQNSVDSGQIGVFLIDNEEGVVKRANYVYGENWLELLSINPEYLASHIVLSSLYFYK